MNYNEYNNIMTESGFTQGKPTSQGWLYNGVFNKVDEATKLNLEKMGAIVLSNDNHSSITIPVGPSRGVESVDLLKDFQITPPQATDDIRKQILSDREKTAEIVKLLYKMNDAPQSMIDGMYYPKELGKNREGKPVTSRDLLISTAEIVDTHKRGSDGQLDEKEITSTRQLIGDILSKKINVEQFNEKASLMGAESQALLYQYALTGSRHPEQIKDFDKRPLNELDPEVKTVMDEIRARTHPDLRALKEVPDTTMDKAPPADHRSLEQKAAAPEIK